MKVISLNSRYGKTNADGKCNTTLKSELNNTKVKFDKIYSIDQTIDTLIGYNEKNYTSKMGWSVLGLSILYIYCIESLFYAHDSFFIIALITIGELFIFGLPKIFYKMIKNLKLSKASNTLNSKDMISIKGLMKERETIKKSIANNKTLHLKYLERYLLDEDFRENFFYIITKNLHLNDDSTLNKSAEYASNQIKKINFGLKTDS